MFLVVILVMYLTGKVRWLILITSIVRAIRHYSINTMRSHQSSTVNQYLYRQNVEKLVAPLYIYPAIEHILRGQLLCSADF